MNKILITKPLQINISHSKDKNLINTKNAIIKPLYIGICGSDMEVFKGKYPETKYPEVRGHEFVGKVKEINLKNCNIKKGDFVLVNPNISCGKCLYCFNQKEYLCDSLKVLGAKGIEGAMQDEIEVPIKNLIMIDNIDDKNLLKVALAEPMAVSIHSLRLTTLGNKVLLFGLGGIGTLSYIYLKERYSKDISIIEIDKRVVKKEIKNVEKNIYSYSDILEISDDLKEKFDSILINCPYDQKTIVLSTKLLKKGGKIIVVGRPKEKIYMDFIELLFKEISIFNSFKNTEEEFNIAFEFLKSINILKYLDIKIFNLKEAQKAFNFKLKNSEFKVILENLD